MSGRLRSVAHLNAPVVPTAGILSLALAAGLLDPRGTEWTPFAAAALVGALLVVVAGAAPWQRLPAVALLALPLGCDAVIGLLRHAQGGSTSGYAPLLVLPALWAGLRLGRLAGALITAATGMTLVLPILVVGAPMYPSTGVRGAVLLMLVAGFVVVGAAYATEQDRRLTATASARVRELSRLVATQTAIASTGSDLRTVMRTVAEEALALTSAEAAVVELPDGPDMVYSATAGTAVAHAGTRVARAGSISGAALEERRMLVCRDSETDGRVDVAACRRIGARSLIVVPLLEGGRTAGVLKVYCSGVDAFRPLDATPLEMLGGMVAAALVRGKLLERLAAQASTDELTGVVNRREWYARLDGAVARARRSGEQLSIVVLDVDGLKTVNDRDGHAAGDRLLRSVTGRWTQVLREPDVLGRLGGDEFGVVLEEDEAAAVAERLRNALGRGESAAAGVATWDGSEPAESVVERADDAMYDDKRARRALGEHAASR